MNREKPFRFPDTKFDVESFEKNIFKNNHYFRSLLNLENRWYVLDHFEIFEQIWDTVEDSLKRFGNYKCFAFHLSSYYYI